MSSIYQSRLNRLRQYLVQQQIDIALITNPTNIYYFSGFYSNPHERFMALIIDANQDIKCMIVPGLDLDAAEQQSVIQDLIPCYDTDNPYILLNQKIGHKKFTNIGLEKNTFTVHRLERLEELYADVRTTNLEDFIHQERLVKSAQDLLQIRHAIEITEKVLEETVQKVCIGMTELELTAELEYRIRKHGGDRPSFDSIILTGTRSCLPHGKPGKAQIKENDFLLIDFGLFAGGFCSDITRTFLIGEGTKEQEKIYEIVLAANQAAINEVKVGTPYGHIDQTGRAVIVSEGYGAYFNNRIGHGLGLELHEAPSIHSDNEQLIAPGHLFTIEPGIYIPTLGGVRIEDDLYVNLNGEVEVLTSYPRELQRL